MFNFKKKKKMLNEDELEQYRLTSFSRLCSGNNQAAIDVCNTALFYNPDDIYLLCNKASALNELKKYQEALDTCNKILKIEPNKVDVLKLKFMVLIDLEKYQEAYSVLDKIREVEPNNAFIHEYDLARESLGLPIRKKQSVDEEEYSKYLNWRKQIEQMPIYERWREDVIKKCGNKCQLNKSHADRYAEVHHMDSLSSIYKKNDLSSDEKIIKCKKLWDIENGIVLCKECHDTMESSKNRQILIQNK